MTDPQYTNQSTDSYNLPEDLVNADLSGRDLRGINLSGRDLRGAKLFKADLRGAILQDCNLEGAELSAANLEGANLEAVIAKRAGFGMAQMKNCSLFRANLEGATLTQADLRMANLNCANLDKSRLREAQLCSADLSEATLLEADLSMANIDHANFNNSDLRGARLRMMCNFKSARWIGTDIRDVNFAGAYLMRREIVDQNFIKEFRSYNRMSALLYYPWMITCDCGRSMLRWCLWIGVQGLLFAWLYTLVGIDFGQAPTPVAPLYFSVVTLTTLGFGDIVPRTMMGQLLVMTEVTLGYMMLGGLLSIFANKLARRGD